MYGEKVEEADELRMDLQDVKEMYKVQVDFEKQGALSKDFQMRSGWCIFLLD